MALIGKIREKTGLTVGVVGIGVILFLVGRELIGFISTASGRNPIVGKIGGKNIALKTFQNQVEQLQHNFHLTYQRTASEDEAGFLREQAWQQLLNNLIYEKVNQHLGLKVGEDELVDMVQGDHIHPDLKVYFTNPETGQFNKQQLIAYLQKLAQMPASQQAGWHHVEKTLAAHRCQNKFEQLIKHSIFMTDLEARKKYELANTTLDVRYLLVPYDSIPADSYQITDTMLKDYLNAHKNTYQVDERRDVIYVRFPIKPTEQDSLALQEELQTIKQGFIQTQEDSIFASIHTETVPYLTFTSDNLPQALAQQTDKLQRGMVIGPVLEGNGYKLYKISAIRADKTKQYQVAMIAKSISAGTETREEAFRKADHFAHVVKSQADFESQAAADSLGLSTAQLSKNDSQLGVLPHAREVVRWVYNEGKIGKVSSVFELTDDYVVVMMTNHLKAGLMPLDQVRDEVKQKVLHEKQAETIKQQILAKSAMSLESLATQYGQGAQVFTAQQVKFNDYSLQGLRTAKKAIGKAFSLNPGQRSQPIAEEQGVVLLEVIERHEANMPENLDSYKKELVQLEQFKQTYYIPKSLETLANTQDLRYKYY